MSTNKAEAVTFPIFLNLHNCLAVVVGGGPVGRRKTATLLAADARVRVVALEPAAEPTSDRLEWRTEPYRADHLTGAALVFACGPADLNRQVAADARALGVWCNSADPPDLGDFFLPAVVRRGDFVVAVSTGGASPALAKKIRQHLERTFDDLFGQWVALLAEVRPLVQAQIHDPVQRRRLLASFTRDRWRRRLRRHGMDAVRTALHARIRALANDPASDV